MKKRFALLLVCLLSLTCFACAIALEIDYASLTDAELDKLIQEATAERSSRQTVHVPVPVNASPDKYTWYEVVNKLVHDLTRATLYQYYDQNIGYVPFVSDKLKYFYDNGYLTDEEYNIANDTIGYVTNGHDFADIYYVRDKYMYLVSGEVGEYVAYQKSSDYLDSVAGDIFNAATTYDGETNDHQIFNAVNGSSEKTTISNYIENELNNTNVSEVWIQASGYQYLNPDYYKAATPEFDWETYRKNGWTA